MTLLALLISADDSASQGLGEALPGCGMAVERFRDPESAIARLRQQRFDTLVLDFDDSRTALEVYAEARRLNSGEAPVTVALLSDAGQTRTILNTGAHFVLYKPLSQEKVKAGLRALTALLTRERRRAYRIPVQAPVDIMLPDTRKAEGILLDLSESGMDVLTAETQVPGALLNFRFRLPDGSLEIYAQGQVAWAKENGQTGIHFISLEPEVKAQLKDWLKAALATLAAPEETVPHCKLTDLSLGGCYVETESPFPEHALIDLCLRTDEMEVHTEGMVRVMHPEHGMGVEFPSRTDEQRAQVGNLISFLRNSPESMLEMNVSPRALAADLSQFEHEAESADAGDEKMEDPLLDLVRYGSAISVEDFLAELQRQRSGESVAQ
jgi:CheY-like chemotaxis protein/c-di-GMP-binding flagellar brake protein YcgR